jgi:hypothetical protein
MSILDLFRKKSGQYELVEYKVDETTFRQGIRLTSDRFSGIVVTISPVVKLREEDDVLKVIFDYTIEANPKQVDTSDVELRPAVGDIILDLMKKDYFNA